MLSNADLDTIHTSAELYRWFVAALDNGYSKDDLELVTTDGKQRIILGG